MRLYLKSGKVSKTACKADIPGSNPGAAARIKSRVQVKIWALFCLPGIGPENFKIEIPVSR